MKAHSLHADRDHGGDAWSAFGASGGMEPADYCSRNGAVALKEKIESYWRERGQDVMLSLHNVGFHPAIRAARFDVRSDMVNGMPRGAIHAAAAERASFDAPPSESVDDFDDDESGME